MFKTPSDRERFDKWVDWYDSLPEHTKQWIKKQPLWHDSDMWRAGLIGAGIGFAVGVIVGFEWAWRPVVTAFKPLVG